VGVTSSNDGDVTGNHGSSDVWVVKLNASGDLQWQKTYGGTLADTGFNIKLTNDGGYIIVGDARSNDGDASGNHGGIDVWAIKINATGTLQWQKSLGGSEWDGGYEILITPNNDYIIVAQSQSNNGDVSGNHGSFDVWVVRLSETGLLQWQTSMGGSGYDVGKAINRSNDNGYIVVGSSDSNDGDVNGNHGLRDFWVVKLAQDALAIVDFTLENSSIYPNPVSDILHIKVNSLIEKITIYNMLGKQMLTQKTAKTINVSSLPAGIYVVELSNKNESSIHKLIKD